VNINTTGLPEPLDSGLTKYQIKSRVADQINWRHKIPVGAGVYSPGREDNRIDLDCFGFDPCPNQRVLDIGASDGFFSFYHESVLHAESVLAMDNFVSTPNCGDNTGIRIASELRQSSIRIEDKSIYDLSPSIDGLYDRVLLLNVLYHLEHPLLGLKCLSSVCKPGAVLYLKSHLHYDIRFGQFHMNLRRIPMVRYYEGTSLNNDPSNYWGPNSYCVESWLRDSGFCDVRQLATHHDRGYFRAVRSG